MQARSVILQDPARMLSTDGRDHDLMNLGKGWKVRGGTNLKGFFQVLFGNGKTIAFITRAHVCFGMRMMDHTEWRVIRDAYLVVKATVVYHR